MSTYANLPAFNFDETRYQTIGRHGFSELSGVPFKVADKYQIPGAPTDATSQLKNLHINSTDSLQEAASYTFELERKVLESMELKGS